MSCGLCGITEYSCKTRCLIMPVWTSVYAAQARFPLSQVLSQFLAWAKRMPGTRHEMLKITKKLQQQRGCKCTVTMKGTRAFERGLIESELLILSISASSEYFMAAWGFLTCD